MAGGNGECATEQRGGPGENCGGDTTTATAHEVAKGDVLLEALLTELDRSRDRLKMDQVKAPYYIEYRVEDVDNYDAEAAFGALLNSQRQTRESAARGGAHRRVQARQFLQSGNGRGDDSAFGR